MAYNEEDLEFVKDQLSGIKGVETRKMFGGVGFFKEGLMFGMIGGGVFRLKVDDENRDEYEKKGMGPYNPRKSGKGMPYYQVPLDVLEDRVELEQWANKAFEAALRAKKK